MNKKLLLLPLLLFLVAIGTSAQDNKEIKKQINNVKKSNLYLYGESTATTLEEAKSQAEDILHERINEWVANKKRMQNSRNIVVNNRKEILSEVSMPRGNMQRSFIYVKKSDIIATDNTEIIKNTTTLMPKAAKVENVQPEAVVTLCTCTEYSDLATKIKHLKATGKIESYARYASLDNPEEYYLAIYNTAGKVVAILSPGNSRKNVKTNQIDNITNYSGCGAIGFKVK